MGDQSGGAKPAATFDAITPEWRDRIAEAVHAGVEATTASPAQACMRYALVGSLVLNRELPKLGISVSVAMLAFLGLAVGMAFVGDVLVP